MSLNFSLEVLRPVAVFTAGYTHNVTKMWIKAGVHHALYDSQGKLAKDVIDDLRKGADLMRENPNDYVLLNPPNGWGDYYGALSVLCRILDACERNPDAVIEISR